MKSWPIQPENASAKSQGFAAECLALIGLSLQALPELYAQVVQWLHPLFGSALTLATVLAAVLNLLLRVGATKSEPASAVSGEG